MAHVTGYSVAIGHFMSEEKLSYAVSTTYGTEGPGKVSIKLDRHDDLCEFTRLI